jgi:acetolactate synthase-1/3 small subunit
MKNENKLYTISVYTEDQTGLVGRIAQIFTRRKINIRSLTTSESEVSGIYRFTIVVKVSAVIINRLVPQIEKIIDVLAAFYFEEDEIVFQEIALYKMKTDALLGTNVENLIRKNAARILFIDKEFCVIEKTGHKYETLELFEILKPYGILEFVRSGRIAISKTLPSLNSYLEKIGIASHFEDK